MIGERGFAGAPACADAAAEAKGGRFLGARPLGEEKHQGRGAKIGEEPADPGGLISRLTSSDLNR